MSVEAKIIADSFSCHGVRLTTMQLRYPRFIHSEFMTHRVFSRNASSSRAIPVDKLIDSVIDECAMPVEWGKNEPGMQAHSVFGHFESCQMKSLWLDARNDAVKVAKLMNRMGAHKQIINRILEPFSHISVIVTATEWENFFTLRRDNAADPTFRILANEMCIALNNSSSTYRIPDRGASSWHLPYIHEQERESYPIETLLKCSAARCARVSYLNHDGTSPDIRKDIALFDRLVGSEPKHSSPVEHAAKSMDFDKFYSNFRGWKSYRWILDCEEPI